jgi:hypothetical protein
MGDQIAKRAAEEYLAARLSQEGQAYEDQKNHEAAIALAPAVWQKFSDLVNTQCKEWNLITKEQTLTCKETVLGDIRVLCAGRPHQMIVHYDSPKRLIVIKNSARPEHETDTILHIRGFSTGAGRDAHLVRNDQPVNPPMLIVGHLRVLAGLTRQQES